MIKTVSYILGAGLLLSLFAGCSKDAQPQERSVDFACKQENVLAPKWTCIPEIQGAYAGVGIAEKSTAGMDHMRRVAMANGRSDLAQQIESQVKDKITIQPGCCDPQHVKEHLLPGHRSKPDQKSQVIPPVSAPIYEFDGKDLS